MNLNGKYLKSRFRNNDFSRRLYPGLSIDLNWHFSVHLNTNLFKSEKKIIINKLDHLNCRYKPHNVINYYVLNRLTCPPCAILIALRKPL